MWVSLLAFVVAVHSIDTPITSPYIHRRLQQITPAPATPTPATPSPGGTPSPGDTGTPSPATPAPVVGTPAPPTPAPGPMVPPGPSTVVQFIPAPTPAPEGLSTGGVLAVVLLVLAGLVLVVGGCMLYQHRVIEAAYGPVDTLVVPLVHQEMGPR